MRRNRSNKWRTGIASSVKVRGIIPHQLAVHFHVGSVDQPAEVRCETCADDYCEVCFAAQHRKGSRKEHTAKSLADGEKTPSKPSTNGVAHAKPNGQDVRSLVLLMRVPLTSDSGGDGR